MKAKNVLVASDGDLGANYTSPVYPLGHATGFSLQAVIDGSPVGTVKLQCSNNGTSWSDLAGTTVAVNGDGDIVWNISGVFYGMVRFVYTRTSGSGTLTELRGNQNAS